MNFGNFLSCSIPIAPLISIGLTLYPGKTNLKDSSKKLESFGIKTIRGMGKTGVVGVLEGSKPSNKKIGLRADMDALPMPEENDFSYKSKTPGKMHACGHDGHMTMLLGAAKYLSETRNFSGTVYFIFSPAEEGGAGAKAMMNDGLFQKCPVDNVWGMHNMPALEFGEFAVKTGTCMASADHFEIKISDIYVNEISLI